jgi:hypothetical protein
MTRLSRTSFESTEADIQRQADIERQRIGVRQLGAGRSFWRLAAGCGRAGIAAQCRPADGGHLGASCARRPSPARSSKRSRPLRTRWRGDRLLSTDLRSVGSGYRPARRSAGCARRSGTGCQLQRDVNASVQHRRASSKRSVRQSTTSSGRLQSNRPTSPSSGSTTCPTSSEVCRPRSKRSRLLAHLRPTPWLRSLGRRSL